MTEICFVRICLPSSEWAAWWQGIGTSLAIFAAIAIAASQARSASRREQERANEAVQHTIDLCEIFAEELRHVASEWHSECGTQRAERSEVNATLAAFAVALGNRIDLPRVPRGNAISSVVRLLELAAQIEASSRAFIEAQPNITWELWVQRFGDLHKLVVAEQGKMAQAFVLRATKTSENAAFEKAR